MKTFSTGSVEWMWRHHQTSPIYICSSRTICNKGKTLRTCTGGNDVWRSTLHIRYFEVLAVSNARILTFEVKVAWLIQSRRLAHSQQRMDGMSRLVIVRNLSFGHECSPRIQPATVINSRTRRSYGVKHMISLFKHGGGGLELRMFGACT